MRAALALVFVAVLASCGGKPSADKCEEVADHMLQIFTNPTGIDAAPPIEAERKKYKAATPTKAYLIERCQDTMSGDRADCILKATDEAALARCGK